MPESPTTNMALTLPTEDSDAGNWDQYINDAFAVVDVHDHSTGRGVKVKTAGIQINADLTYSSGGSYYAITAAKAVQLQPQAAASVTSYSGAIFVNSSDNELYWRNTSGTLVKLTSGTTINASSIGGIGGDYGTVGATVDYVDASDIYRFRQQIGAGVYQFARIAAADIDFYEYQASGTSPVPSNRVRIKSPTALAASYDLTLLTALPGSTSLAQVSAAGALSASNTVANAVTLSGGIANNVTLTLGATAAVNQHFTVSGTGSYKHGAVSIAIPACEFSPAATAANYAAGTIPEFDGGQWSFAATTSVKILAAVPLPVGKRITGITWHFNKSSNATALTMKLRKKTAGSAAVDVSTTSDVTSGASYTTASASPNYTVEAAYQVYLEVTAGNTAHVFGYAVITYDEP